jgi:hypothetical protein
MSKISQLQIVFFAVMAGVLVWMEYQKSQNTQGLPLRPASVQRSY